MPTGIVTLDFGTTPVEEGSVAITGQTAITADSFVEAFWMREGVLTTDESAADTFTRADDPSLGANWTENFLTGPGSGGADQFSILGNKASSQFAGDTNASGARFDLMTARKNWDVSVDVTNVAGTDPIAGLFVRAASPDTYYKASVFTAPDTVSLIRVISGFQVSLGTAAVSWGTGVTSTLRFSAIGNKLRVFFAGSLILDIIDVSSPMLAPGSCGLLARNLTAGSVADFDNFAAQGNDFDTDEHDEGAALCPLSCGDTLPGVGFTVFAHPTAMLGIGTYRVRWVWS